MKKIIGIVLAVTVLFTGFTVEKSDETIVVCSSAEQFRNEEIQEKLEEKFPEYNIVIMYMPTGKAATKVAIEGDGTDVDILVGLETGYLSKIKENLADIDGRSRLEYLKGLNPEDNENKWVTWERFGGAIIVNEKLLQQKGIDEPESYEDLLKPEYKNLIAMPDPKSSGTGYFFYKNWVNEWGEDKALAYVDRLQENLKQFTESGSGPIKLMIQGETAIGLAMTFQAVSEINEGLPFKIIFPEEGSPYSLTGTAIIKDHENKEGVSEVFDYLIHDCLVYDKEYYSPEQILEEQKNRIPNYPENIQYADMEGISDAEEKERLLSLWKY